MVPQKRWLLLSNIAIALSDGVLRHSGGWTRVDRQRRWCHWFKRRGGRAALLWRHNEHLQNTHAHDRLLIQFLLVHRVYLLFWIWFRTFCFKRVGLFLFIYTGNKSDTLLKLCNVKMCYIWTFAQSYYSNTTQVLASKYILSTQSIANFTIKLHLDQSKF